MKFATDLILYVKVLPNFTITITIIIYIFIISIITYIFIITTITYIFIITIVIYIFIITIIVRIIIYQNTLGKHHRRIWTVNYSPYR